MYGAVGCDYGESITLYDDDPDGDYEDPNYDGWALITKKENGLTGFFPEAYITNIKAVNPAKIANKPNPVKPKPPNKKTSNHPDGKPVKMDKHAPASKASGGIFACCSSKPTGKAAKKRAIELAVDEDDVSDDDDDDGPEVNFQPEDQVYGQ